MIVKVGAAPTKIEELAQATELGTEMAEVPSADQQKGKNDAEANLELPTIGHDRTASNTELMKGDKSTLE